MEKLGKKALDNSNDLFRPVIIPRTILSWAKTVGTLGFEGSIPGVKNSYFCLYKNENTFEGALKIKDELFVFEDADISQVVASLGVALEIDLPEIDKKLKNKDLTNLGKSIDVLVKSEIIKKAESGRAGPAAAATAPKKQSGALSPSKQEPYQVGRMPSQSPNLAVGQGQKDQAEQVSQKLKITKGESTKKCQKCEKSYFQDSVFIGCDCLKPLAKAIDTEKNPDGYTLVFKVELPQESLEALIMLLKD